MELNKDLDASVVVPFYNRSNFLLRLLDSIENQTLIPKKVYIIDNGSNEKEALRAWNIISSHRISNICVFTSTLERGNANYARNLGYQLAETKYVAYLDSDDWWGESHLLESIKLLESENVAAVYSGAFIHTKKSVVEIVSKDVNKLGNPFELILSDMGYCAVTPSYVVNKSLIDERVMWDVTLKRHQDYDYFASIFFLTQGWVFLPSINVNVDRQDGGTSSSKVEFASLVRFYKKWHNKIPYQIKKRYLQSMLYYSHKAHAPKEIRNFYFTEIEHHNFFNDYGYKIRCNTSYIKCYHNIVLVLDLLHLKHYVKRFASKLFIS